MIYTCSGINKILDICKDYGVVPPKFDEVFNGFMVTLFKEKLTGSSRTVKGGPVSDENDIKSSAKSGVKGGMKLTQKQQKILDIIKENPTISIKEVAQRLSINNSAAQKYFDNLKKKKVIVRIEAAKGGYWKVIDKKEP